ncbi:MAG: amidohydrolase family protein [Clostridiales bacterium]|nr:amidohydrolase family protein [Clostridiales bacterium]
MADILIKNGRVWDGERFYYSDILINMGKIEKILPKINTVADFIYDAAGKTVLPGLVDMHAHLRTLSSDSIGVQAEMGCFPFGVTAAADTEGCSGNKYLSDLLMVKNVVFVTAAIKDNKPDFEYISQRLSQYKEKAIGIKVFYDLGSYETWSLELLEEICAFARKKGLKVMVHSTNAPSSMSDIVSVLKKGDILTHIFHGGKNSSAKDNYNCMIEAKNRGIIVDLGFEGINHTDFGVFKNAIDKGVKPDTISTDITKFSVCTLGGRYGMTMVMSAAKTLGMSEEEIFKAVTSAPAVALGKTAWWGHIKEGRCGDVTVLDYGDEGFNLTDCFGNNIKSEKGYRCALTVVNGRVIYRNALL